VPNTPENKPAVVPDIKSTPMPETNPAKALPNTTSTNAAENSGILTVWVPYDAKVVINGQETRNSGSRREYVSFGLKQGYNYKYVVKAQIEINGRMVEDTQTIVLTAGQIKAVAFGFNAAEAQVAADH
jgi:uncharacterized protein (TIGR03000 family)